MAYDIGGRGDKSFNDAAAAGLDKAKTEFGVDDQGARGHPGRDRRRQGGRGCACSPRAGYNPVIAVGFAYADALKKVAAEFPDVNFAIVDDARSRRAERHRLVFAENEGSFLVGAAAALKTKTGNVGFVGGVNVPLIAEVPGRLRRRRQGGQPGHQGRRQVPDPAAGLHRASTTRPRARPPRRACTTPAPTSSSRGRRLRPRRLPGGRRPPASWRSASTPTSTSTPPPTLQAVIMTSMLKRVDVAVYDFIKSAHRTAPAEPATQVVRPQERTASATPRPAAWSTTSRPSSTTTSSRSSPARSRCPTTPWQLDPDGTTGPGDA